MKLLILLLCLIFSGCNSEFAAMTSLSGMSDHATTPTFRYGGPEMGTVGSPITVAPIEFNGGGAPITSCTAWPALPAWASIHPNTCVISGYPTSVLPSTSFMITATNFMGASIANVMLTVVAGTPVLSYSGAAGTVGAMGTEMSIVPAILNDRGSSIFACEISSPLPVGLVINPSTCVISGTPISRSNASVYVITATNAIGSSSASVTIEVKEFSYLTFQSKKTRRFVGNCIGPFVIGLKDSSKLLFTQATSNLTINLSDDSSGTSYFHESADCSDAPRSTRTVLIGMSWSSNIYFKTTAPGHVTLTASDPTGAFFSADLSIKVLDRLPDTWVGYDTSSVPTARDGHSAIWTGSEMIIWGGFDGTIQLKSGGRYNPVTDTWGIVTSITGAPDARSRHSAIWTGSEMIIWGGSNGAKLNSGGRYNPVTNTWGASPSLTGVPEARFGHSAVWTGTEMIIWGGINVSALNTGARYNPTTDTWGTSVATSGAPIARHSHSAVWTGSEMIIWGGQTNSVKTDTGGLYDPSTNTWKAATSTVGTPGARVSHSAIWTGSKMIVWGGSKSDGTLDTIGGSYDPISDSWGAISTSGAPTARFRHTAVWTGAEMIIWGGDNGTTKLSSGKRYNPVTNTWGVATALTAGSPAARYSHSAVWTGSEMIIWGGTNGDGALFNTGNRYRPVTDSWSAVTTSGALTARKDHAAVWTGSHMIVWGGYTTSPLNTGGIYNPSINQWISSIETFGAPTARSGHSAIWTGTEMIIWGGSAAGVVTNSGGRYDPTTNSWVGETSNSGVISARSDHSAIWTGTEMIIWGGIDSSKMNSGGRYNPTTNTWGSATSTTGAPTARHKHTAIWTGSEMVIWGGIDSTSPQNTGGRYDPVMNLWGPGTYLTGPPSPRMDHSAIWTGFEMIIWGGVNGTDTYNDLYYFIP